MRTKENTAVDAHVGERLRERREELGMSQTAVAEALGVTFQQVQKYERGTNRIGAGRLHEAAAALHVDVPYFFEHAPGQRKIRASVPSADHIGEFTDSEEGHRLMRAFLRISRPKVRRQIRKLVELLSG